MTDKDKIIEYYQLSKYGFNLKKSKSRKNFIYLLFEYGATPNLIYVVDRLNIRFRLIAYFDWHTDLKQ